MKKQYVADLKVRTPVSDIFYIAEREVKDRRDGGQFMRLELADKTGSIVAVVWDNVSALIETARAGTFARVNGVVGEYNGKPQLTVSLLQPAGEHEIRPADFLRTSAYPIEEMYAELAGFFREVTNPHLRKLLDDVFADAGVVARFKNAPGGARVHHAYLGGLLEHTLFMLRAARSLKETYPEIDFSLLVTGIILHDLGKIDEYKYDLVIDHTYDGRLIGHVVMGYRRVAAKIAEIPDFPEELGRMILHMLLSHHGELEFGAAKTPKFVEAYLLHMLDHMDAWTAMFREVRAANPGAKWTEYHSFLETNVYVPDPPAKS